MIRPVWQLCSPMAFGSSRQKAASRIWTTRSSRRVGLQGTCGIGHTRWATHGAPSDVNAHPHQSQNGRIAVVHNGIIENFLDLRHALEADGYQMRSQTDTEVVSHLLEKNDTGDGVQTLLATVKQLRGSYALAILSADRPQELLCTRRDNPLIIGVGQGENMIASDIPAIIAKTKQYIVLDDNEVARVTADEVQVFNALGQPVQKEIQTVNWDISSAEKGGYDHFMIKEIMEQPKAVRDTVSPRIENGLPRLDDAQLTDEMFHELREYPHRGLWLRSPCRPCGQGSDRAVCPGAGICICGLGIPLPQPYHRQRRSVHRHQSIGRNS